MNANERYYNNRVWFGFLAVGAVFIISFVLLDATRIDATLIIAVLFLSICSQLAYIAYLGFKTDREEENKILITQHISEKDNLKASDIPKYTEKDVADMFNNIAKYKDYFDSNAKSPAFAKSSFNNRTFSITNPFAATGYLGRANYTTYLREMKKKRNDRISVRRPHG
jgi:hypothetical protein